MSLTADVLRLSPYLAMGVNVSFRYPFCSSFGLGAQHGEHISAQLVKLDLDRLHSFLYDICPCIAFLLLDTSAILIKKSLHLYECVEVRKILVNESVFTRELALLRTLISLPCCSWTDFYLLTEEGRYCTIGPRIIGDQFNPSFATMQEARTKAVTPTQLRHLVSQVKTVSLPQLQ